jgi:hypothetical protein
MAASILAVSGFSERKSARDRCSSHGEEQEKLTVGDEGAEEQDQSAKDPARIGERERVRQQTNADQDIDPES